MRISFSTFKMCSDSGDEEARSVFADYENMTGAEMARTTFHFSHSKKNGIGTFFLYTMPKENRTTTVMGMPAFRSEHQTLSGIPTPRDDR